MPWAQHRSGRRGLERMREAEFETACASAEGQRPRAGASSTPSWAPLVYRAGTLYRVHGRLASIRLEPATGPPTFHRPLAIRAFSSRCRSALERQRLPSLPNLAATQPGQKTRDPAAMRCCYVCGPPPLKRTRPPRLRTGGQGHRLQREPAVAATCGGGAVMRTARAGLFRANPGGGSPAGGRSHARHLLASGM